MTIIKNLLSMTLTKKYWHNVSEVCDTKRHPTYFHYRRYRKGKNRCSYCGAKIGKIKCKRSSFQSRLIDNIFSPSPILRLLQKKGSVL